MNKKGQFEPTRKQMYWLIASFIIVAAFFVFIFIIGDYMDALTQKPEKMDAGLVADKFLHCLADEDKLSLERKPYIIDLEKFDRRTINECHQTVDTDDGYNFQLVLKYGNKKEKTLETTNFIKHSLGFWLYKSVLVKDGNRIESGQLAIRVQKPFG